MNERRRHAMEYVFMLVLFVMTAFGLWHIEEQADRIAEYGARFVETCEQRASTREVYRTMFTAVASSEQLAIFNEALPPIDCED